MQDQPNMNTPLVQLTFTTTDAQRTGEGPRVTRLWYHVPSAGDLVEIVVDAVTDTRLSGEVRYVEWTDTGCVVILV